MFTSLPNSSCNNVLLSFARKLTHFFRKSVPFWEVFVFLLHVFFDIRETFFCSCENEFSPHRPLLLPLFLGCHEIELRIQNSNQIYVKH
jgi:hypothetical protein